MVAMSQLIDAAVNQKPAGLVVSIPDASALGPSIQKAVAAGIPVISMNSGSDVSKKLGALLHVGQDEFDAGKAAGEKLASMGGKVGVCVNHEVGNVALDLRCKGFAEGFKGKVTTLPVSNDPSEIRQGQGGAFRRQRRHGDGAERLARR
jgi:simple sugar transport system substrate-binding protein